MSIVTIGLIQASHDVHGDAPIAEHKELAIQKHLRLVRKAAAQGAQIVCLQEIFYGPYFCAEQTTKWYDAAEEIPNGHRKHHIPHVAAGGGSCGFWEKYYFKPGNLGYPVFDTSFAKVGVYICYDRHFPEGARVLGLGGAEIVFNPSATVAGTSEYLWKLEQPAHAVANGYYVAAINRVGTEAPWNMGEFYGQSYLVDPRGSIVTIGSRDQDEVIMGEMDKTLIREVRNVWQFYRDRRPETYDQITQL